VSLPFTQIGDLCRELSNDNRLRINGVTWEPPFDTCAEIQMWMRVFVGCVVELMSPAALKARNQAKRAGVRWKRGAPKSWTFQLSRPVKVDCRSEVIAALERAAQGQPKGRAPSVQTLVRGHWKRQACGVGRAARRYIHVEPYWRGPEDAPIAVRSHVLVKPEEAQPQ